MPSRQPTLAPGCDLDPERRLSLLYAVSTAREDLASVWQLDTRLHRIFAFTREAALAEIKLAWWEERLRALRTDAVPLEPLLRQLAATTAVDRSDLASMAEGWRALFAGGLSADVLAEHARKRGRGLVGAAAAALGGEPSVPMLTAGEAYALVDLAASRVDREERDVVLRAASERFRMSGRIAWPRALRPVGMIVELARVDAARGVHGQRGSPARVARMAWHAMTGR